DVGCDRPDGAVTVPVDRACALPDDNATAVSRRIEASAAPRRHARVRRAGEVWHLTLARLGRVLGAAMLIAEIQGDVLVVLDTERFVERLLVQRGERAARVVETAGDPLREEVVHHAQVIRLVVEILKASV